MTSRLLRRVHIRPAVIGLLAMLLGAVGCANWTYQNLRLGARPRQYDRVLPRDYTYRTSFGLTKVRTTSLDRSRSEAVAIWLTEDRLLSVKAHAYTQRQALPPATVYTLEIDVERELAGVAGAGPVDVLRVLLQDLAEAESPRLAQQSDAWIAAGLIRLAGALPAGQAVAIEPPTTRIADQLEDVPAGGVTTVDDTGGTVHYVYQVKL